MKQGRLESLKKFQGILQYNFNDISHLDMALTHSSYVNENRRHGEDNERLEFLGDSVVNLIVTEHLYKEYKDISEGDLTKVRAKLICESSFAWAGRSLGLEKFILLGRGEENSGGRKRDSLIADAFEALCGAIYLDSNFNTIKSFLTNRYSSKVKEFIKTVKVVDFKTQLQELVQKNRAGKIKYKLIKTAGPDHEKTFFIELYIGEKLLGKGTGKSKKEAEQKAAQCALVELKDK